MVFDAPGGRFSVIRRHPLRVVACSVFALAVLGGLAAAVERYFTTHIDRKGPEQSLVFQLDAPYGSVNLRPGSELTDVATIETLVEDADARNCSWSYGLRDGTVGMLRIGIGTDEGMMAMPPIAMWHANSGFSLAADAAAPQSDRGISMRPSPFFFFSMPPVYDMPLHGTQRSGGFACARRPAFRTISTDAGTKIVADPPSGTQIYLTKDFPLVFIANFGFGQSKLDLSGLPLTNATIETGASQAFIYSNAPNPEPLQYCTVHAGIGSCTFLGISNLNADHFTFHGAVGSYHLGFEGRLTHNLDAYVEIGLGMCSLSIPPTAGRVQVFYDDGLLSSFSFSGLAIQRDGYARSPGFDHSNSPILTLHLSSGAGKMSVSYH